MKRMFKLSGFILIMALFSACFSPWAGDPGVVTITFGGGGQEAARSAVTREEIPTLTHIITLYGNGTPVNARLIGAGTVSISARSGNWNIRIRAESPEPYQALRALGFGQVQVVAGRSTPAAVYMVSATEVANHAQLAAAISSARTDGLEKIIVLTQDMYASAQFSVGTNRHISLVSDSDVAIRRGAGFNPEVEMFVMQGNATLRLGRYGTNGSVYVQGATGAVFPPLQPTPPGEEPTAPPAYTQGLDIDANNVLHGIGDATGVTDIVIPHGVISIADDAFYVPWPARGNLTSVTIPNSVISIGSAAFDRNNLESVIIPNSVTYIGARAFADNNLESVTIPNSVQTIGDNAFINNNLTGHLEIPNNIGTIGMGVFTGNNLTSVTIHNRVTSIGHSAFHGNNLTGHLEIPNSVTYIGPSAFQRNLLTNVTIGNRVTTIGNQAFVDNYLTSVTIPDSVTTIGLAAFTNNALTSVIIPPSVTSVGPMAFENNALTSVIIHYGVRIIGQRAFYRNNNLASVTIPFVDLNAADAAWGGEWWRQGIPAGVVWNFAP